MFSQQNLKLNTLQDLISFFKVSFFKFAFLACILSLAGIPPFGGFFLKFFTFYYLFFKKNVTFFSFMFFLNFLSIFFYLQNVKFLTKADNCLNKSAIVKKNLFFINATLIFIFFLIFGFFFLETIIIFITNLF
jgi:NADH:ubiquinone oxidoreductase subunit 2 (subunit N)